MLDLTKGNVRGKLIHYSLPLIITSLLQSLYSMMDILIAGRFIGSSAISAINNSGQLINLLTQIAIGITLGGNILIGQCFGAGEEKERKEATGTLFSISIILGILSSILVYIFSKELLQMLGSPALEESQVYLKICAMGGIYILGYNALSSIMRGVGDSKTPLLCIICSTILNIILDLIFICVLNMGTKGAAIATLFSQVVCFAIAFVYMIKKREYYGFFIKNFIIRKSILKKIFKLGIPCVLQNTIGSISWLSVTFFINKYGVDVSAANGISIKIKEFCQLFIASMANGATTMIAQNIGSGMYDRAKNVLKEALKINIIISITIIIIVEIFSPWLVSMFTMDSIVETYAVLNLRIEIIGQLFYAGFLTYHALMAGAGQTMYVFGSSFVNCILFRVVLVVILEKYIGIEGVYLACMIAPSISVLIGHLYTRSNIWRRGIYSNKLETS